MNLTDYLKHKEDCALIEEPYFGWCDVKGCKREASSGGGGWRETGYWKLCDKHSLDARDKKPQPEMLKVPYASECTCSLSSIQSRLVLLPEDFKQKLLELLHEAASTYSRDGGWEKFTALHSDEFESVVDDIEKLLKG